MKPASEVHQEAAAVISDAVATLTARAVQPALEPFGALLNDLADKLDKKIDEVDGVIEDDRKDRQQLARRIEAVADVERARDERLAASLGQLHTAVASLEPLHTAVASLEPLHTAVASLGQQHAAADASLGQLHVAVGHAAASLGQLHAAVASLGQLHAAVAGQQREQADLARRLLALRRAVLCCVTLSALSVALAAVLAARQLLP